MSERTAIAIAAHPDDIEFTMAGTLLLLREAGWAIHYLNVSSGSCGSTVRSPAAIRRIRRREALAASKVIGAVYHESRVDDLEILYTVPLLRWLTGVIREVCPTVVLTHPPVDYMEDHTNTCRLAVTAAFARGMKNFASPGKSPPVTSACAVYHAMPYGLCDPLGRPVTPGAFVDTTAVQQKKLEALACHESQHLWLKKTQGLNSYLLTMQDMSLAVGRLSRGFAHAEGWWRHSHMGFGAPGFDPLGDALGTRYKSNPAFTRAVTK